MPLYEYYCADCRDKFELFTTFEASAGDIVCVKCHGGRVRKLFSVFAARSDSGGYGDDFSGGDDGMGGMGGCACGGACSCGGH